MHQNASNCFQNEFFVCSIIEEVVLLHLNRLKCIKMHRNASKCIKMHQNVCRMNYSNVLSMKFQFEKNDFFSRELPIFSSKCSKCINMHRNASKCMQNELCKCFVHKITKEVVFITFKVAKIDENSTFCSM